MYKYFEKHLLNWKIYRYWFKNLYIAEIYEEVCLIKKKMR